MSADVRSAEWTYLRGGLFAVAALFVAALVGWGIQTAVYDDPGFRQMSKCLINEKGATLETPRDPIATGAELGALRTVVETNGVTASVAGVDCFTILQFGQCPLIVMGP